LNSISANNNGDEGAVLDNAGFLNGLANVILTGTNNFKENDSDGLVIFSDGIVTVSNVAADDNGIVNFNGYGLYVDNSGASTPKAVTLTGFNEFYNNYSGGIRVGSDGAITISNLTASWNQNGDGVYLENNHNPLVPQNVTVSGYANASNNIGGSGLIINTYGVVSLINVAASYNSGSGLEVDNYTGASLLKSVTISGNNDFNGNGGDGLLVNSLGAITVNNVRASDNGGFGAYLDNNHGSAVGGISVLNTATYAPEFARNGSSGLEIYSRGNILVKDLDAYENGQAQIPGYGYGVYLDNSNGTGTVTIGTSRAGWFNGLTDNFVSGLEVYTNGTVTINNVMASGNGLDNLSDPVYGYGARIENNLAATPKNVTLLGANNFSGNNDIGLYILTKGAVILNKIIANDNGDTGAFIDNNANNLAPQNVTLNGYGEFNGNVGRGLEVQTFGVVLLNSVYADSNNSDGVFLDNFTGATMAKGVTIKGYVNTVNNSGDGLYIHSLGAIAIAYLDSYYNGNGATLDNNDGATPAPVTITGNAATSENAGYGMTITSKGAITINVFDAWIGVNGGYGWFLQNNFTGAVGGVTLTPAAGQNFDFVGNGDYGLLVQSLGAIKVTNLDAFDNFTYGAELDNAWPGSVGTVTITTPTGNNSFNGNGGTGLTVYSNRAITITNLYASDNGLDGVYLDNTYSGAALPQPITINTKGQFYNNGDNGLTVYSYGVITTNNLTANGNGINGGLEGWGVILDNCNYNGSSCDALTAKGVAMNGINEFSGNLKSGVWVRSLGTIKGSNFTANGNGFSGAYLYNLYDFGSFGVTLTGSNSFASNAIKGLWIETNGVVTLNNIDASLNTNEDGLYIYAVNTVNGPPNVTLTGTNTFLGNGATGLSIFSTGIITLNNITAKWNIDECAHLNNYILPPSHWVPVPANTISLLGVNNFNNNGSDGLYFYTYGNASITRITADNNGGIGVNGYSNDAGIAITCGSMTNNGTFGWQLNAFTTVTLKGVFATGNGNPLNTNLLFGTLVVTRTCPLP